MLEMPALEKGLNMNEGTFRGEKSGGGLVAK
jgi:hypothetical protein